MNGRAAKKFRRRAAALTVGERERTTKRMVRKMKKAHHRGEVYVVR